MTHPFTLTASPPYVLKAIVLDVNAHELPYLQKMSSNFHHAAFKTAFRSAAPASLIQIPISGARCYSCGEIALIICYQRVLTQSSLGVP
jgi:hypothetical protein